VATPRYTFFVYGTLMEPQVLSLVSGEHFNSFRLRPAVLHGYRRVRVADATYPGIYPAEGSEVQGFLARGLSEEAVRRIDAFENDGYDRQNLQVISKQGTPVQAAAYVASSRMKLTDEEWDFEVWRANHRQAFLARLQRRR